MGSSRLALPARTVLRVARLGVATTGAFVFVTRGIVKVLAIDRRTSQRTASMQGRGICLTAEIDGFVDPTRRADWLHADHRQDKCSGGDDRMWMVKTKKEHT